MSKIKIRLFFLSFLSFLFFVSCSSQTKAYDIVAIDFPSYDSVRAILKDVDNVMLLLPPGAENHHYEPTPKDMIALSKAKLVVYTGGESDSWVDTVLSSLDSNIPTFKLIDQVSLFEEEEKTGMTIKEEHSHLDGHEEEFDEHVWTSPINEISIIKGLTNVLVEIYPENRDEILNNSKSYINQLEELDKEIRAVVNSSKYNTLIFGSRFPLRYFVEEYGLEYFAAFPGCAEETEPSARTIAFLIDKVKELGVNYVLDIEFGSPLIVSAIAEEAGVEPLVFNSMHNISAKDFIAGENYISIMKKNIEVLKEVLN